SSRRRHTRSKRDWSSDVALPISKRFLAYAIIASFVIDGESVTTKATGDCPHLSSCLPTTPTSRIPSIPERTLFISDGYTFSPPDIIKSVRRATTYKQPASSTYPRSPVANQPSTKAFAVAAGLLK